MINGNILQINTETCGGVQISRDQANGHLLKTFNAISLWATKKN